MTIKRFRKDGDDFFENDSGAYVKNKEGDFIREIDLYTKVIEVMIQDGSCSGCPFWQFSSGPTGCGCWCQLARKCKSSEEPSHDEIPSGCPLRQKSFLFTIAPNCK